MITVVIAIFLIAGSLSLLVAYAVTFYRLRKKETMSHLFMKIIVLLMLATTFTAVYAVCNFWVIKDYASDTLQTGLLVSQSFAYAMFDSFYSTAHWLFAFEYFSIGKVIPLALKGIKLSAETQRMYQNIKMVVITANILTAFLTAVFLCIGNISQIKKGTVDKVIKITYATLNLLNYSMLVACGIFILYAVFSIGKYMRKGLRPAQINAKNLYLHTVTFLLFTLGLIVEEAFFLIWVIDPNAKKFDRYMVAAFVAAIFNYLSSMLLCWIIYQYGERKDMPTLLSEGEIDVRASIDSAKSAKS